jgi:hypothetical protein
VALVRGPREIVRVNRNNAPSAADLIFVVAAPLIAIRGSVKLTQADGDLSAHIRMGQTILSTGHIPVHSLASYTAAADPMAGHAWLSEIIFALLFRWGGLPLLCVVTGIIVGLTHGMIALFLRKRGVDPRWAFLATMLSLALASTHWLTRPHMFSIVGAALTLFLLESERPKRELLFIPLFVIWTNLHGGWMYGLAMIAMYIVGDLAQGAFDPETRSSCIASAKRNSMAFAIASLCTLVNPFGIRLDREVFGAVTSTSLAKNIAEYQPPNFQDSGQWPFLLAILGTLALFSLQNRRIRLRWLGLIVMSLFFALRSFRNIALFGVTAWPLIALQARKGLPRLKLPFRIFPEFARLDPNSRVGILAAPVAVLMLAVGLNHGKIGGVSVIADTFNPKKFPTEAVARARQAGLEGRVFDNWAWGGYIMYAWPEARLHVDPLKFNDVTIKSYTIIEEMRPGWQQEMDRWQIQTVLIASNSPMSAGLMLEPAWKQWYRDSTAVIFRRVSVPAT